jgi:hypothetical protein
MHWRIPSLAPFDRCFLRRRRSELRSTEEAAYLHLAPATGILIVMLALMLPKRGADRAASRMIDKKSGLSTPCWGSVGSWHRGRLITPCSAHPPDLRHWGWRYVTNVTGDQLKGVAEASNDDKYELVPSS